MDKTTIATPYQKIYLWENMTDNAPTMVPSTSSDPVILPPILSSRKGLMKMIKTKEIRNAELL
jgi:hypothetical protein